MKKSNFLDLELGVSQALESLTNNKKRLYYIKCKQRYYDDIAERYFIYPRKEREGDDWEIVYSLNECGYNIMTMKRGEKAFIDLSKTRDTFDWAVVERLI